MIDFLIVGLAWLALFVSTGNLLKIIRLQNEVKELHRYIVFVEGVGLDSQRIGDEEEANDE